MARIVTTQYRYKRPPKKRKPVAIKVPEVVTVRVPKRVGKASKSESDTKPTNDDRKARIVTTRPKRGRFGEAPNLMLEKHQQRGDAATRYSESWSAAPQVSHEPPGTAHAALAVVRRRQAADGRPRPSTSRRCLMRVEVACRCYPQL